MGGRWVGPVTGGRFACWSFSLALETETALVGVSRGKKRMCTYAPVGTVAPNCALSPARWWVHGLQVTSATPSRAAEFHF